MVNPNQNQEIIEVEEVEHEALPDPSLDENAKKEETGITAGYLQQLDYVASNIDKHINAHEKIWLAILKIAKEGDWVIFGDGQKQTVCLSGPGAERIAKTVGVSFINWKEKKEIIKDAKGDGYRYWFTCTARFGGRSVLAMGRASSRDKFFGKVKGELRPLEDIAEDNIRMAAFRGAMKEGVRILFGLRNIPKIEFDRAKIPLINTTGYTFQKPADAKAATSPAPAAAPAGQAPEQMSPSEAEANGLVCGCGEVVSEKVRDFSKKKFGKTVCFECQKKENG